jgi:hypothetical protein
MSAARPQQNVEIARVDAAIVAAPNEGGPA